MAILELTYPGGYKTKSNLYGFEVLTDYPEYLGGENTAPAPWDFFLVALASCQGIHIRNYCVENNISMEGLKITLDEVVSEDNPNRFTDFNINIILPKDFPKEHKKGLLAAARSCRVVKHLCEYPARVNQIFTEL